MRRLFVTCCLAFALMAGVHASQQMEDLKSEVDRLRAEMRDKQNAKTPIAEAESACDCHFGPNEKVTTKDGKLTVGALVQVWSQNIQHDRRGLVVPTPGNMLPDAEPNSLNDNSTYRIRRTELRFTLEINDNINAFVLMDPARESNILFTPAPTFPVHNTILTNGRLATGSGQQAGSSIIPQLLQDAYINFHGFVPHHDFTVGQFKPPSGEEAWRNSGQLDFADRAMVTSVNNVRDIGLMAHGSWKIGSVDNRVQYWVGMFNGATGTVLNDPEIVEGGNRPSTQQHKDIAERLLVNPIWDDKKWYGRLQIGGARTDGTHGQPGGQPNDLTMPQDPGLDRSKTSINRDAAWLWYRPGSVAKGLWFRGEYGDDHDVFDPRFSTDLLNLATGNSVFGAVGFPNGDTLAASGQANPKAVTVHGFYGSTGYRLSDSIFAERLKDGNFIEKYLHDTEFAFRYEQFTNVAAESPVNPDRDTDLFHTSCYWLGVNYYLKGYESRMQINYIIVENPVNKARGIRNFHNNQLLFTYQVLF